MSSIRKVCVIVGTAGTYGVHSLSLSALPDNAQQPPPPQQQQQQQTKYSQHSQLSVDQSRRLSTAGVCSLGKHNGSVESFDAAHYASSGGMAALNKLLEVMEVPEQQGAQVMAQQLQNPLLDFYQKAAKKSQEFVNLVQSQGVQAKTHKVYPEPKDVKNALLLLAAQTSNVLSWVRWAEEESSSELLGSSNCLRLVNAGLETARFLVTTICWTLGRDESKLRAARLRGVYVRSFFEPPAASAPAPLLEL